ncbi:pirin family protein [Neobacillus cucumis]|nr:pirin family protein [Neobacillus cucumis]
MLKKIESGKMGSSDIGWLKSKFHFSFADYFNPDNIHFGVLRVINDDLVEAKKGFGVHPHRDMEIISYVVNGELTHGDSMGNNNTVTRGQVQYMSAGTGVLHSEYNLGEDTLRFLQIWVLPVKNGLDPNYGDFRFNWEDRKNNWLHMVSDINGNAPIKINQDANIYSLELEQGKNIEFPVKEGRQAYLVQIEGTSLINDVELNDRDGMEIIEENISIKAVETSHILIIEMEKQFED